MTELWEHSKDKLVKKGKTTDDEIENFGNISGF